MASVSRIFCRFGGKVHALTFDDAECGSTTEDIIRCELHERTGIPAELFTIFSGSGGRRLLRPAENIPEDASLVARVSGLRGGKGGFGALLRGSGKGKGSKRTSDFGACRDLSGRRLRHVNNEIALRHWRDESRDRESASKRKETFESAAQKTRSGIEGWFLGVPSWSEMPSSSKKKGRQSSYKTIMCAQWKAARAQRSPPEGCPPWWGCPRGRQCRFAHGIKDLRGNAKEAYIQAEKDARRSEKDRAMHAYLSVAKASEIAERVSAAVEVGMKRSSSSSNAPKTNADDDDGTSFARIMSGDANVRVGGGVHGVGNFSTLRLSGSTLRRGTWFYEVTLLTEGLMQIGWAEEGFRPETESGDGVGDDRHSWAYDGLRQRRWNGEAEGVSYGLDSGGKKWRSGDIVGCLLHIANGRASFEYFVNGDALGVAYADVDVSRGLFPALSLNGGEALRVNVGQVPFSYAPSKARAVARATPRDAESYVVSLPEILVTKKRSERPSSASTKVSFSASSDEVPQIDLESLESIEALVSIGADALKMELRRRKLPCGGTLEQRASRLWSVRGLSEEEAMRVSKKSRRRRKRKRG